MTYAGFWRRFWASILDTLFLLPLTGMIVYFQLQSAGGFDALMAKESQWILGWTDFLSYCIVWIYCALFESGKWQATPGKRFIGIYVTDIQGERIGFGRATFRFWAEWFPFLLSMLILQILISNIETIGETAVIALVVLVIGVILMGFIQYIMAGLSTRKQTLYDMMCGTLVYRGKPDDMVDNIQSPGFRSHEDTAILSNGYGSSVNRGRWVIAGFTTTGHVIRLPFDMGDMALLGNGIYLGRDPAQCDLVIDDPSISRRHARLYVRGDELFIEDLNSTNGITVNGIGLAPSAHTRIVSGVQLNLGQVELSATR